MFFNTRKLLSKLFPQQPSVSICKPRNLIKLQRQRDLGHRRLSEIWKVGWSLGHGPTTVPSTFILRSRPHCKSRGQFGIPNQPSIDMVYQIQVPRLAQARPDPDFWDRLRTTLQSHMQANHLKQRELAEQLALDPATFNNFLKGESKTIGGQAVALAYTLCDIECSGGLIGRLKKEKPSAPPIDQLVIEFDRAFEVQTNGSNSPTIYLRKSPKPERSIHLFIKQAG